MCTQRAQRSERRRMHIGFENSFTKDRLTLQGRIVKTGGRRRWFEKRWKLGY